MKEFQLHQVLLPIEAIVLKYFGPILPERFPALIAYIKMDEYSGTILYNAA